MIQLKIQNIYLFYILIFVCGCNNLQHKLNGSARTFYSELKISSIQGNGHVAEGDYPEVEVNKINPSVVEITYFFSEKLSKKERYIFNNAEKSWSAQTSFMSDTGYVTIIKKVYKDRSVWLHYENQFSGLKPLFYFTLFKDNVRINYSLKEKENVTIGEFDFSFLKKPMNAITTDSIILKNKHLKIVSNTNDLLYKQSRKDTICYDISGHSINWWYTFGDFLSPLKTCK